MGEQLKIACGVFGAINFQKQPIFSYIYWGLRAQNHRGHQSHGFLTYNNGKIHVHRSLDLVPKLKTNAIQEWFGRYEFPRFSYECDADLICHKLLIELVKNRDLALAVKTCMQEIEGAFSVAGITKDGKFFAFKDPYGIRPLCAGHNKDHSTYAFSSETVGLNINELDRDFELEPGELVTVSKDGFRREKLVNKRERAFCAFEFAYFARPDSRFDEKYVYEIREEFGRNLVRENPDIVKDANMILSLPETGDDAALGVHEESDIKWERASRRHRYVTERAFILLNRERYSTIDKKINILAPKIRGKRVIVTDDSIVRGDTTKVIVEKLRKMGAKKVYVFITFPRIIGPCFYGIDMATYGQLIGSKHSPEEITEIIGADAVCYQSIEGFIKATGFRRDQLCLACLTGKYPTPLAQKIADEMKKRFLKGYEETGRLYEITEVVEKA